MNEYGILFDDDELNDLSAPSPVDTIAGPITPKDAIAERNTEVRQGTANEPETGASTFSPQDMAAMDYARGVASDAGIGRAINALASGYGAKVDNSGYDSMVSGANTTANKMMDRSARVQQYMAASKAKQTKSESDLAKFDREQSERERHNRAVEAKLGTGIGEERANRAVEHLAGKLGSAQDAARTIQDIESQIGFNLDDYNPTTNKAGGRLVDLPGVSIPGLGRFSAYSGEGRVLADTASRLFNLELKDRSGTAVTTPELARLRQEYSQGKFNTEPELLGAMQRYKTALIAKMHDIEAMNPAARDRYAEQGGTTSAALARKAAPASPPPPGGSGGMSPLGGNEAVADDQRRVVRQFRNKRTGQIKYVYSDGTEEIR